MDYNNYLKENYNILKMIDENNIKDEIIDANENAIELSKMENNRFLHSYRYSKIYDVLSNNNLNTRETTKIVELLENKYDKSIDTLLNDYLYLENAKEL